MRVITGDARGRQLKAVEGMDVRPTAAKVKEAVFSAVQFEVEGARMLDLFCGSGQMGIEGLSRGAASCIFIDSSKRSIETAKENLTAAGLFSKARVAQMDYKAFLTGTKDQFDVVFLDPPYSMGFLQEALPLLVGKMSEAGVILAEHEETDLLPEELASPTGGTAFKLARKYRYGRISISAYRRAGD